MTGNMNDYEKYIITMMNTYEEFITNYDFYDSFAEAKEQHAINVARIKEFFPEKKINWNDYFKLDEKGLRLGKEGILLEGGFPRIPEILIEGLYDSKKTLHDYESIYSKVAVDYGRGVFLDSYLDTVRDALHIGIKNTVLSTLQSEAFKDVDEIISSHKKDKAIEKRVLIDELESRLTDTGIAPHIVRVAVEIPVLLKISEIAGLKINREHRVRNEFIDDIINSLKSSINVDKGIKNRDSLNISEGL